MAETRSDFSGAMIGSLMLHAVLIVLALVAWPNHRPFNLGSAVPVNLVSNAPTTDVRAADQSAEPATAQTEIPEPDAALAPAEVATATPPSPPAPVPATTPATKPAKPTKKAAAEPRLDLDALAASLNKTSRANAGKSSAAQGANSAETALQARPALGKGLSASAQIGLAGLAEELQRRWNPNCEVEGGRDVRVRVNFTAGVGGQLIGVVEAGGQENSSNPVVRAAAERAIRAVHQAAPFKTLPRELYGVGISVNFDAGKACQ